MELAKVMSKGQVTIPINIRKKLNLKEGDKVLFIEKDGNIIVVNSAMLALQKIQSSFEGEAERLGLGTEDDVVDLVKEIRREAHQEKQGNNI
ncbi:AbrB/MazE/SpoVT family DNA-binding domain-containing protein [Dehalobacterium formicoaceticum]|uniref:AbrB/MazE/SpoVT family DNA-binding domain-containing protein n=1 Tax=Dehalobacterium formicoaceticum TaxID=51515 RepID=A0ABT1Y7W3_9FIRM|nr:AbrB/MazE/SpoVT family DNA-binding domain-containing protein [Dehalobacterium formicoaceticum]MCR6546977.1 AbrB/MazE/SpoVT family DNA-binding domain-containing protein [Dehalobacterium formicoaceticum]